MRGIRTHATVSDARPQCTVWLRKWQPFNCITERRKQCWLCPMVKECCGGGVQVEQSHWVGQWAKLTQRPARGQLDVKWDLDASAERIVSVKQRRADARGACCISQLHAPAQCANTCDSCCPVCKCMLASGAVSPNVCVMLARRTGVVVHAVCARSMGWPCRGL